MFKRFVSDLCGRKLIQRTVFTEILKPIGFKWTSKEVFNFEQAICWFILPKVDAKSLARKSMQLIYWRFIHKI